MWAAESTTLDHVRLKHSQLDPPAARLRLSYLLSSVEFQPASMPPAALFIVRSMRDPLPGRIVKKLEPGVSASGEWEQAARSRLTHLYRNAVRPAMDIVAPSAEAVLFADWGEMLASCACDVLRGNTNAWWWRSVARRFSLRITSSVTDAWRDYPRYVPAALQLLTERGEAARIVESIPSPQAWQLLLAILRDSGLFRLAQVVSECLRKQSAGRQHEDGLISSTSSPPQAQSITWEKGGASDFESRKEDAGWQAGPSESDTAPPWELYVAAHAAPASLDIARRTLLGIALLLRRNLNHASSVAFQLRLKPWLTRAIAQEHAAAPEEISPRGIANPNSIEVRSVLTNRVDQGVPAASKKVTGISLRAFAEPGPKTQVEIADQKESPRVQTAEGLDYVAGDVSSVANGLENGECTGAAGVFYLIHFLRESEIFRLDVGLSGWALLELLARCLLDSAWSDVSNDSIWTPLALLDGREPGTPPGVGFQPQATYEAPKSWLHGLDASNEFVRFRSEHVETWHDEGFLTLDSRSVEQLADRAVRPVTRKQKRAWRKSAKVRAAGLSLSKEMCRFLHFVLPYARWRLAAALPVTSLEEVLLRRGLLYVTRTHIDVLMNLSQIHLGTRLAGLDSSPGWVPELGHVVTFHFDEDPGRG